MTLEMDLTLSKYLDVHEVCLGLFGRSCYAGSWRIATASSKLVSRACGRSSHLASLHHVYVAETGLVLPGRFSE